MNWLDDFDRLQQYLDGTLSVDDCARLEAALKTDPELAAELVRLAREEAIYRDWAGAQSAVAPTDSLVEHTRATSTMRRRRLPIAWIIATATIVLFGMFVTLLDRSSQPQRGSGRVLAVLEDIQGIVEVLSPDGRIQAAEPGQQLFAGEEVRTGTDGSSTLLRWADETKLHLSAETRVLLTGDNTSALSGVQQPQVFVTEGIVAADIPDNKSLIILSDHAELRNAHGRISFVSLPERTFVETDSGFARLVRKSDGTMVDVHPGYFAVASKNRTPLRPKKAPQRQDKPRRSMLENPGAVAGLMFDPEGTSLSGVAGDAVKRWELRTGQLVWTLRPVKKKPIKLFALAEDGKLLAAAMDDRAVRLFDAVTGEDRLTYRSHKRVTALAISADSRILAIAWHAQKEGTEVRLYDTTLGIERLLLTGQSTPIQTLAFSPTGNLLVSAGGNRSIRIWDVPHLTLAHSLAQLPHEARTLAFSADEKTLAIGERSGQIRLVDTMTGSDRLILSGHLREVLAVAFSPDGRRLASGSADGTARLWQLSDGREVATFRGHKNSVRALAFAQDGRTLATGGVDRAVLLWDVVTLERK